MGGRCEEKEELPDSGWYAGSPPSSDVRYWCVFDVVAVVWPQLSGRGRGRSKGVWVLFHTLSQECVRAQEQAQ